MSWGGKHARGRGKERLGKVLHLDHQLIWASSALLWALHSTTYLYFFSWPSQRVGLKGGVKDPTRENWNKKNRNNGMHLGRHTALKYNA